MKKTGCIKSATREEAKAIANEIKQVAAIVTEKVKKSMKEYETLAKEHSST